MLKKQIDAKGRRLLLVGGSSNFSPFVENTHNRFPSTLLSFPIFRFSVCKSAVNILYMQVSTVNKLHMHMICTLINFFSIFHSRKCASLIHIEHYTLNVHLYCTMLPFTIFHFSWIPLNIHILSLARWPPFVVDKIRLTNLQRTGGGRYHIELCHIIFISS